MEKTITKSQDYARLERVTDRAVEVLGDQKLAVEWLDKYSASLGSRPRELAQSSTDGMNRVLFHLQGIERSRRD